jgi:hypothetical protein
LAIAAPLNPLTALAPRGSTDSWSTGISDVWSNAADWSTGAVPGVKSAVLIDAAPAASSGVSYVVSIDSSYAIASLTLDHAAATLAIQAYQSYRVTFTGAISLKASILDVGTYDTLNGGTVVSKKWCY